MGCGAAGNAAGNEHFWYSLDMVGAIAKKIAQSLTKIDPAHAGLFATNLTAFDADLNSLASELEALAATNGGKRILATEPLADYLTANAGLTDATPSAFKAAIEGDEVVGRVGNNVGYAPWVIGGNDTQARVHQGRWYQLPEIVKENLDEVRDAIEEEWQSALNTNS